MDSSIILVGFVVAYLALQLWVLPRFGIGT